jgi:hypothetical protein
VAEVRKRGGAAAIDYVRRSLEAARRRCRPTPAVRASRGLKGKNISRHRTVRQDELKLLIAPTLLSQAKSLRLDVSDYVLWRSLRVEAEPRCDHFHSPACRH